MKNYAIWGLILLLSMSGFGSVMGQEPDPAEVKRRMEIYMRDDPAEAKKSAPAPKPRPKPVVQPKPPKVDHDREAWQSAEKCGTAVCFEVYLEDYPKGRYAKMARARLKTEEVQVSTATITPIPTPPPTQTLLGDRYRDNDDGTVTDVKTGLQWMRCSLGQTWQGGTCTGEAGKYTWQAAMDAAETFNRQGGTAGYNDWRMPTKEELKTLIYCSSGQSETQKIWGDEKVCAGNFVHPTIYQPAFPNMPNFRISWRPGSKPYLPYWTSSPHPQIRRGYDMVWTVDFFHGVAYGHFKEDAFGMWYEDEHVRFVRDGQ